MRRTSLGFALAVLALARAAAADLRPSRVWKARDGSVVRYEAFARGVPVWRSAVAVRLGAQGRALRVESAERPVGDFDPRPSLSDRDALFAAARAATVPLRSDAREQGRARLVVIPGARPRLAFEVHLPPARRTDNPYFLVDARTGALLARWNRVFHDADPDAAQVFADARAAKRGELSRVRLAGFPEARDPAGHLAGARVLASNCCPNAGCDGVSPPPVTKGSFLYQGTEISIEIAHCEERPLATNQRPQGDYVFQPAREPGPQEPMPAPSEGDPFAEVHAYYHANQILDFVAGLDPDFQLAESSRPLQVIVNYLDAGGCQFTATSWKCLSLVRFDNGMFVPAPFDGRERDTILLGQGAVSDFAYDADVVYHEFGHAVVYAAAGLEGVSLDEWGAFFAPDALHEAYADWLAAVKTSDPVVGDYVGERARRRGDASDLPSLRDISAPGERCPDTLTGEPHQDSRAFSGALWDLRVALAPELTAAALDRAVLDALKTLPPDASFDTAAQATLAEIQALSPAAAPIAEEILRARGALGCARVWPVTVRNGAPPMLLASRTDDPHLASFAPGPVQLKMRVPEGASAARLSFWPLYFGSEGAGIRIAWSAGEPVRFGYETGVAAIEQGEEFAAPGTPDVFPIPVSGKCGGEDVYVALLNYSDADFVFALDFELAWELSSERVAACKPPAPPPPPPPPEDPGADSEKPAGGCGCGESAGAWPLVAWVAFFVPRRRI
jgi:hypothetical protein